MHAKTYEGLEGIPFGSTQQLVVTKLGEPNSQSILYHGTLKFYYDDFSIMFDKKTKLFNECAFDYQFPLYLNNKKINWTIDGFNYLCVQDGHPLEYSGAIVLLNLGVSLPVPTELPDLIDNEYGEMIAVFQHCLWDDCIGKFSDYIIE